MFITEEEKNLFIKNVKDLKDKDYDKYIIKALNGVLKKNEYINNEFAFPIEAKDVAGERYSYKFKDKGKTVVKKISLEDYLSREYQGLTVVFSKSNLFHDEKFSSYFVALGNAIKACYKASGITDFDDAVEESTIEVEDSYGDFEDIEVDDIDPTDPYELYKRLTILKLIFGMEMEHSNLMASTIDELYEELHMKVVNRNLKNDLLGFVKVKK